MQLIHPKLFTSSGPTQIAYVTNDLARAMDTLTSLYGLSHFFKKMDFEPENQVYRGTPVSVRSHTALAWASNLFIEIIQPLTPDSPFSAGVGSQDFSLALHHLGFDVEDWDQFSAELARNGRTLVYSADVSGFVRFGYLDALEEVGHFLEFYQYSKAGVSFMEKIKSGAL